MKNSLKRVLALVLAGAMAFSFAACNNNNDVVAEQGGEGGKLFAEGTTIKMTIPSHPSWPYNENWIVWDYIEEATGAKVEVNAIPSADIITKVNLMMASQESLPDLLFMDYKGDINVHAMDGAFVNIRDHLDNMPNFQKIIAEQPAGAEGFLATLGAGDGNVYFAGTIPSGFGNARIWMHRRDIFEKNNLKVPETKDELIEVSRKLKEIYPGSYPLCFRNGLGALDVMGSLWKEYFTYGLYYDFNNEQWNYGAQEDVMIDLIEFFQQMLDEDLVPADFLTIATKSWEELILTDRGFMMPEYVSRINFFNTPGRESNPDYTWAYMDPPEGFSDIGVGKIANYITNPTGFGICNTGDDKRIANAIKYIDWLYSDEASELLNWGKEGETHEVLEDGSRKMLVDTDAGETEAAKFGFGTMGISLRGNEEKSLVGIKVNPLMLEAYENFKETTVDNQNPLYWIGWNEEEQDVYDEYYVAVDTYTKEMLAKFILKQAPMSEYDKFKKELDELGVKELLAICNSAYDRAMGK